MKTLYLIITFALIGQAMGLGVFNNIDENDAERMAENLNYNGYIILNSHCYEGKCSFIVMGPNDDLDTLPPGIIDLMFVIGN
jgi:hypothetical protein